MPTPRAWVLVLAAFARAQATPQDPAAAKPTTRTVVARIVDERGAPVAGACLALGTMDELTVADALAKPIARSGEDGRLSGTVDVPALDDKMPPPLALLITAPGKVALGSSGYVASLRSPPGSANPYDLGEVVLFDAVTLRGRLRDPEGKPIAGGRIVATDAMPVLAGQPRELTLRSVAVSDEKGLFTLPGVFDRALELTFAKDGFYQRRLRPVGRETPLVVELKPSGFVSGKALDAEGKGFATTLTFRYECGATRSVRTEPDGSFRTTVLQPGRYRVQLAYGRSATQAWVSPLLEGPQAALELRPAVKPAVSVAVRAVDAATGAPLEGFSAVAAWYATQQGASELLAIHAAQLGACGEDRRVMLVPNGLQRCGTVVVTAPGHAPEAVPVQLEDTDTPKELTVKLGGESSVAGKVVDPDGKGVGGVRVWAVGFRENNMSSYSAIPPNAVTTAADGTFRVGGIGAGHYCVQALREDLLVPAPESVEVEAAKAREGVVINVRRGKTLRVELPQKAAAAGWKVRIEDPVQSRGFGGVMRAGGIRGGAFYARSQQIAGKTLPDGATLFENLEAPVTYRVMLSRPGVRRLQRVIEVQGGMVDVPRDEPLRLDPSAFLPVTITGSVDCAVSGIATDRVVVLAVPHFDQMTADVYAMRTVYGAATLGASGAFALEVGPGKHDLCVLDAGTGQVLYEAEEPIEVKPGAGASTKIALAAARVRVQLVPAREGIPLHVAALSLGPAGQRQQQRPASYLRSMLWSVRGDAVLLDGMQTEAELWLLAGEYACKATSRAGSLADGQGSWTTELGSDTLSVPEKGTLEVKLEIGPPPATRDLMK